MSGLVDPTGKAIASDGAGPVLRNRLGRALRLPPSMTPVNKRTDQDRENLRIAAERRKRKTEKRAEAIRKAKVGQRHA